MDISQQLTPTERQVLEDFFKHEDGRGVLQMYLSAGNQVNGPTIAGQFNLFIDRVNEKITIDDDHDIDTEPQVYSMEFLRKVVFD